MKLKKAIIVTLLLMLTFNFNNIGENELLVGSDIDEHIIEIL